MKKLLAAAAVLLAAVAVPASLAAPASAATSCLVSAFKGCIPPPRPDHYAVEECLSLHGYVNYGELLTVLSGYVFEDDCYDFAYIGHDGAVYHDTFNFTASGGGGVLVVYGEASQAQCASFGDQWVWQAKLCTYKSGGSTPPPPLVTAAARTECLSLHGTVASDNCSHFIYFDSYGDRQTSSFEFNINGFAPDLLSPLITSSPATKAQCVAFRTNDPVLNNGISQHGEPTQWVWQAGLCTI